MSEFMGAGAVSSGVAEVSEGDEVSEAEVTAISNLSRLRPISLEFCTLAGEWRKLSSLSFRLVDGRQVEGREGLSLAYLSSGQSSSSGSRRLEGECTSFSASLPRSGAGGVKVAEFGRCERECDEEGKRRRTKFEQLDCSL